MGFNSAFNGLSDYDDDDDDDDDNNNNNNNNNNNKAVPVVECGGTNI